MSPRELLLLTPYRLPAHNSLYLADDEVAAFLNGFTALWHPAALAGAANPPRVASPYDHEQPSPGHVYAVPDQPPLMLPEDWKDRVRHAGAVWFEATADRTATLSNLKDALHRLPETNAALLDLPADAVAPFFGVGLGHVHVEALFEAMSHENLLDTPGLWGNVQEAVARIGEGADAARPSLQAAAEKLQAAREVLYPVTVHVVELVLAEERPPDAPWPEAFARGLAVNLIAPGAWLEQLKQHQPARFEELRAAVEADRAEVCGGGYVERDDTLLPTESQLWNLRKGQAVAQDLLGRELRVLARRRFGFHPQTPQLAQAAGLSRVVLLPFDESVMPHHRACVVSWPSADGKQVEAFARAPHAADSPQTYFHLAHYLYTTMQQDPAATLAVAHRAKPACPWYRDLLELAQLSPVLGRWTTLSNYFTDVVSNEYATAAGADEFQGEHLVQRANPPEGQAAPAGPVSAFAAHVRARRRLDTALALAALYRGLGAKDRAAEEALAGRLAALEDRMETSAEPPSDELGAAVDDAARRLAERLVARGPAGRPGFVVLNPSGFTRRVALELPGVTSPLPVAGAVKACQLDAAGAKVVLEVPGMGFAWLPRHGVPGTPPMSSRLRLADKGAVRNEFFEAELDPATGGLRGIRDHKTRASRLGLQLVYNPGSQMRVKEVKVTSAGPALGEVVAEGTLLDTSQETLATFRLRYRAWAGRPLLELRAEIVPAKPVTGYPWHAYYGARFAWMDERAALVRGVQGVSHVTSHTRPETPDYLEVRTGAANVVVFPGGLPFHQRQGGRMLDVILVTEHESATAFDLGVGMDRPNPMQTAQGLVTPSPVVEVAQGPPHVGATGWLFHLDAPNVLLTGLRPAAEGGDGVEARLLECAAHDGPAEFRCARDPVRAVFLDGRGQTLYDATVEGDAVKLDVNRNDLVQLRVEFS